MPHFADDYLDRIHTILHKVLTPTWFYKLELLEVPGIVTGLFVTYDGLADDSREIKNNCSLQEFKARLQKVSPDWDIDEAFFKSAEEENPKFGMGGWERRTVYMMRAGSHPEFWTAANATEDITGLLMSTAVGSGKIIEAELEHLREIVPPGPEHFREFEHVVRVTFNWLFIGPLGEGKAQSRTQPEDEGVEIRDLIFANNADSGFWSDLKHKYSASEIVVDAKNKDEIFRDDLRQLYCYLKPALGFWGFIVCRRHSSTINAFNRALFRNFNQARGVLILSDDDLRKMVKIKMAGQDPATYLQQRMSEFVRSI